MTVLHPTVSPGLSPQFQWGLLEKLTVVKAIASHVVPMLLVQQSIGQDTYRLLTLHLVNAVRDVALFLDSMLAVYTQKWF